MRGRKEKVLIVRCRDYDPEMIAGLVREGMEELGLVPEGRVLLKPNVVIAHPRLFPHAFTRKEFLDGVLGAVKARAKGLKDLAVGERSGITMPTRWLFRNAGYPPVLRKHQARACYFDEEPQIPVQLRGPERLRDHLYVPKPIEQCDFLINLPKFKAHPWTRLTLSLKNFIGIQDDRHRLVDHNSFLEHKIADLQEVIQPKFVAVDAIVAGQKMMLTPTPFPMGAIVMGTNSCAVDTVGCHMVHVRPRDLIHLRLASERGLGPMSLDQIELGGDFPLEEVQELTHGFGFCLERVDRYFGPESPIRCTVGSFPERHSPDYCWGGCPGALQEAVHILRAFYTEAEGRMKPIHYVVGKVEKPLDLRPGERVLFAGNCTAWEGMLDGHQVSILPSYRSPREEDTEMTRSNDLLLKTLEAGWNVLKNRNSPYVHARGCPVSVADHLHYLWGLGGVRNVNFDPRISLSANFAYWQMRFERFRKGRAAGQ